VAGIMTNTTDQSKESHSFLRFVERVFASPYFSLAAVAIALLLTSCSVHNGLIMDDYYHRAVLTGSERYGEMLPGPQGMFRFVSGDPEITRAAMDVGLLPWFTDPNLKIDFFQLIPTQTHILDYWLWPDHPELMHVHNLVWFALLVFVAAIFYRRIFGPTWMAGVALLLFAVEDGHALPAAWICNRNTLIAATLGIGCLIAHDAWRREKRDWTLLLALVLWALSLLSKEAGIATCAYLFAYAVWLDKATLWQRFLTLVPYGMVLIIWRAVRDSLGYGVANMGGYVDPITDPVRFATALLERYPVLLFGQWGGLSEISLIFDDLLGSPYWWIAAVYVCFLGLLFWPIVRRDPIAGFFATGMLLAVIPICAALPMDRLLMFVGLGAFGLLVRFWSAVFSTDGARPSFALWRVVAVPVAFLLVLIHFVAAPLLLTVRAAFPFGPPEYVDAVCHGTPFDEKIEEQDLVVVNSPGISAMWYVLFNYEKEGMPSPRAIRALAPGFDRVIVERTDDRTLEVEAAYLDIPDNMIRNEQNALQVGDQVQLARMTATVLATEDGRPTAVAFRFDTPLENSALRWVAFYEGEFVPWTPPQVGEQRILEANLKMSFD
jgi:hypothetical protein